MKRRLFADGKALENYESFKDLVIEKLFSE